MFYKKRKENKNVVKFFRKYKIQKNNNNKCLKL